MMNSAFYFIFISKCFGRVEKRHHEKDKVIKDTHNPLKSFSQNLVFFVFRKYRLFFFVWIFVRIS